MRNHSKSKDALRIFSCLYATIKTMTSLRNKTAEKTAGGTSSHLRRILFMVYGADPWIHYSMIWLAVYGLLMIGSASMGLAVNNQSYLPFTIAKQVIFLSAGFYAMSFLSRHFDISFLRSSSFASWALGIGLLLVMCLFFPAVGGARAWIRLPVPGVDVSIQPSEFAKVMTILIVAAYCGDVKRVFKSSSEIWKRPLIFVGAYMFIILVLQGDLGSMAVIMMIAFICVQVPSHPQLKKFQDYTALLFLAGVIGVIFILSPLGENLINHLPLQDYQINRFLSSINPFVDQFNTGYQLVNGLISFASGGWFGLGYGNSVRKYTRFPAANTDFILSIVVEELGFFGFLLLFIPYCIIIFRLIRYARRITNEKAKIILIGVASYFVVHIFFNIGGVTAMIPLTGVPLLMISAGGSSTFAVMAAVGIAQAVVARIRTGEIQ